MATKVLWIRYLFILIAIFGTMFLSHIPSLTMYTFQCLLFMALDRLLLRERGIWQMAVGFIQLSFAVFLFWQYEGIMFILFYSTLLNFLIYSQNRGQHVQMIFMWVILNGMMFGQQVELIIIANLMYVVMATVIYLIQNMNAQKEEIQSLYDSLRKNHFELEAARKNLEEYAQKVEQMTQLEERNRISKTIHDEIGHQLIRCKMMMEAVIKVLPTDKEKGMELIYQVRDHMSSSMDVLRNTVRKLKPTEEQMKSISLKKWIERFAKESGVEVDFKVVGEIVPLFPSIEVVLYRNTQEAFSNAIRHGKATKIAVELSYQQEEIHLIIQNNGSPAPAQLVKGLGLRGMEERVEMLGGTCSIVQEQPFTIKTVIPFKRKAVI